MTTTDAIREQPRRQRLWLLALLVLVFAIYAPSLGNGFAFDGRYVVKAMLPYGEPNAMTAELHGLDDYFSANYWAGNVAGNQSRLYRPATILSYAVTNAVTDGVNADPNWEAFPHHLINVLLKVGSVLLAYLLIARLARGWPALLGAAAFGCHALHSEVVAGLVGRAELLAFCCGALATLQLRDGRSRLESFARGTAAALLLFASYCSKESAVAWCPFAILFAALTSQRLVRTAVLAILPLIAFLWLRHTVVAELMDMRIHYLANPLWYADTATRVRSAVTILGYGLFKCLWPMSLTSDYGPVTLRTVDSWGDPRFLGVASVLLAALAVGLASFRRRPLIFAATALFFGFSFLVSNIPIAIGTIFGERLYFTPSLGVAMVVGWVATRTRSRWLLAVFASWLIANCVVVLLNNGAWRDEDSRIFRDARANPDCIRTLEQKARIHSRRDEIEEAEAHWQRALTLDPDFQSGMTEYTLFLAGRERFDEAERRLLRALDVPDHHDRNPHITHYNLVVLYEHMKRQDKMLDHLRRAWREESAYQRPHEPLIGPTLRYLPPEERRAILQRAPAHPTFSLARGQLALNSGDLVSAEREFRRVRATRPAHHGARFGLGIALKLSGDGAAAETILTGLRDDPNAPAHLREQAARAIR